MERLVMGSFFSELFGLKGDCGELEVGSTITDFLAANLPTGILDSF